jgi:Tol biopolymer transport system component
MYTASATLEWHDPSKRLESVRVDGGVSSVLLKGGTYTYECGSVPSARCVLGEMMGRQLVFSILDPAKGKGAEIQRVEVGVSAMWSLSPDGNKIAIIDPKRDGSKAWILTVSDGTVVTLALQGWKWKYMQSVAWSADGSHLFATAFTGTSFVILFIDLRGNFKVLAEVPLGEAWFDDPVPSPDGHYLAYMKRTFEGNVMMLELFAR